ncbi:hypothetical protein ACJX0J_027806, partial [Zea mays]
KMSVTAIFVINNLMAFGVFLYTKVQYGMSHTFTIHVSKLNLCFHPVLEILFSSTISMPRGLGAVVPGIQEFNMLAADSTENTREQDKLLEIYIDVFTFKRIKRDYKRRFAITEEVAGRRKMPIIVPISIVFGMLSRIKRLLPSIFWHGEQILGGQLPFLEENLVQSYFVNHNLIANYKILVCNHKNAKHEQHIHYSNYGDFLVLAAHEGQPLNCLPLLFLVLVSIFGMDNYLPLEYQTFNLLQ